MDYTVGLAFGIDAVRHVSMMPPYDPHVGAASGTALWLTHLGGSTAQTRPMLERLASRGLLAVSFDSPGHGRRGDGSAPWASS